MPHSGPSAAISFLIEAIFTFYSYIILARLVLQLVKSDFYNPVSQFVVKATNPLLIPLRRIIPGFGGIDNACIVLLLAFQLLKWVLISLVIANQLPGGAELLLATFKGTITLVFNFFLFAIFIQVIVSWIAPGSYNPIIHVLNDISEPLLAPARRLIPPLGGLDLSPMLVILTMLFIMKLFGLH